MPLTPPPVTPPDPEEAAAQELQAALGEVAAEPTPVAPDSGQAALDTPEAASEAVPDEVPTGPEMPAELDADTTHARTPAPSETMLHRRWAHRLIDVRVVRLGART